jgi:hypothetical protein
MHIPINKVIDHINRNPLDNHKSNLRICSQRQNVVNSKKKEGCVSKYKGVSWDISMKRKKRWYAACEYNNKQIKIGRFATEIEAALAYNKKAKELWGEYVTINNV